MIIRLKEESKSVCGLYIAHKEAQMDVIKYDEKLEIYHCKMPFAKDDSIVYEVCKESAEVVQEQKPEKEKPEQEKPTSDYHLPNVFSKAKYFDYYMFARAQQAAGLVIDPEIAHVQKKLFVPYRGHKSTKQDVIECIKTLQSWLENNEL
jgi:hypothetical protein